MRQPTHPGIILYDGFIEPNQVSITEFAAHLGFSRETLSRLLHGKTPMTANLALALEDAGVSRANFWLNLQSNYDLWQIRQNRQSTIMPFEFTPVAVAS